MPSNKPTSNRKTLSTDVALAVVSRAFEIANKSNTDYALAGGVAMHLYGFTRATSDIDVIASKGINLPWEDKLYFGGEVYYLKSKKGEIIELDWIVRNDYQKNLYEAALKEKIETEEGIPIISPEWMVMIKIAAGRGKDEMDVMWLLTQKGLVNRNKIKKSYKKLYGADMGAFFIMSFSKLCIKADILNAQGK